MPQHDFKFKFASQHYHTLHYKVRWFIQSTAQGLYIAKLQLLLHIH